MNNSDDDSPDIPDVNDLDGFVQWWLPRNMMNRTSWLHRVDALCAHDIREINILWEVTEMCLEHCNQFFMVICDTKYDFERNRYHIPTTIKKCFWISLLEFYRCFVLKDISTFSIICE